MDCNVFQNFLMMEERKFDSDIDPNHIYDDSNDKESSPEKKENPISIKNFSAKWIPEYEENTLNKINLQVKKKELVAVIGHVGSGKVKMLNHDLCCSVFPLVSPARISFSRVFALFCRDHYYKQF